MGKYIRLQKIGEGVQGKDNKAKEKIANFKIAKKIKLVKIFSSEKVKQGKIKVKYGLFARKLFLLPIGALSKKQESMEKELTIKHQVSNDKKEKQRIEKQKMKSLDIKKFTAHISRGGKIRKSALPARIGWSLSKKWELSSPKQNLAKPVNNKKTKQENNRKELRIKNRELRCVNKESQNLAEERKQKDWVVLDEKRGEKFALKNVKSDNIDVKPNTTFTGCLKSVILSPQAKNPVAKRAKSGILHYVQNDKAVLLDSLFTPLPARGERGKGGENDLDISGMPEAVKKEPWNFIRIKDSGNKKENATGYILDDFDTLQEFNNEIPKYEVNEEKYVASPYVVNLGQKSELRSKNQELRRKEVKKLNNWKLGNWRIRKFGNWVQSLNCSIGQLAKKKKKAMTQAMNAVIRETSKLKIRNSLPAQAGKLEIKNFLKNFGDGLQELSGKVDKLRKIFFEIFSIKQQALSTAVNFSIIALILILPIYSMRFYVKAHSTKGKVMGAAYDAFNNLKLGKDLLAEAVTGLKFSKDSVFENSAFEEANIKFDEAKIGFEIAQEALDSINNTASTIALRVFNRNTEVKTAMALIKSGEKAAEISKLIGEGLGNMKIKTPAMSGEEVEEGEEEKMRIKNQELRIKNGGEGKEGGQKLDLPAPACAGRQAGIRNLKLGVGKEGIDGVDCEEGVENCRDKAMHRMKGGNLMDIIARLNDTAEKVLPEIEALKKYLSEVDMEIIPNEYKKEIGGALKIVEYIEYRLLDCIKYSKVVAEIFGGSARYLLIFQNDNELRATGGFIGSYSLVDIKNGEIVNYETPEQGSYALQGELLSNIEPPNALQLINGRWEFHDSNWWPDFPRSAENIRNVYEKSGGPTVDGVIAINASFVEDLLEVLGDIEMPLYGKVITSGNFVYEAQKSAELEYDRKENKPKKIIADLMPRIIEKIFNLEKERFMDMLSAISGALRNRDIQIYSADIAIENKIMNLGWGGEIKDIENRDYLAIIDTNLGGRKTDGVIDQRFNHNTHVLADGAIVDELTIFKKHNGIKGDYFEGVNNVDYLRIYVPFGAVLLEAEGFDPPPEDCYKKLRENIIQNAFLAYEESKEKIDIETGTIIGENFGKTYFANWTQVDPGEEIAVRIKYKLPFKLFDSGNIGKYSLYIQKQAGSNDHAIVKKLELPDNVKSVWSYPGAPENGEWIKFDKLGSDRFYGGIFVLD